MLRDEDILEDGTPERAVQSYIQAVRGENYKAAHALLSYQTRQECPIESLAANSFTDGTEVRDSRVTLKNSYIFEETAMVTTEVTHIQPSSPFGASKTSQEHHYTLRLERGQWKLTRPVNSTQDGPWPHFNCREP